MHLETKDMIGEANLLYEAIIAMATGCYQDQLIGLL